MDLIDTPNPNAKKVLVEHDYEIAIYINKDVPSAKQYRPITEKT